MTVDPWGAPTLSDQVSALGGTTALWAPVSDDDSVLMTSTGACAVDDRVLVARRRVDNKSGLMSLDWRANSSDVVLNWMDPVSRTLGPEVSVLSAGDSSTGPGSSLEDPRLHKGREGIEVWCATWGGSGGSGWIRQVVIRLDDRLRPVSCEFPPFGQNPSGGPEKNWGPIRGTDLFVYSAAGEHVVIERTSGLHFRSPGLSWDYGPPHGGSPPILVGDRYLTLFQSCLNVTGLRPDPVPYFPNQYFVGAYTFGVESPYPVLEQTISPLISGSFRNLRTPGAPAIVYPAGVVEAIRGDELLFTVAVNECRSGWVSLPIDRIFDRLVPVHGRGRR